MIQTRFGAVSASQLQESGFVFRYSDAMKKRFFSKDDPRKDQLMVVKYESGGQAVIQSLIPIKDRSAFLQDPPKFVPLADADVFEPVGQGKFEYKPGVGIVAFHLGKNAYSVERPEPALAKAKA